MEFDVGLGMSGKDKSRVNLTVDLLVMLLEALIKGFCFCFLKNNWIFI